MQSSKAGRKTVPPSDLRADRIKELMRREKLSQEKLGEALHMAQQNISRILKSAKISEETIDCIVDAFPNYRKQWLLGYDAIPTVEEWERQKVQSLFTLNTARKESDLLYLGSCAFASLNGYIIETPSAEGEAEVETVITALHNGYIIKKDGKSIRLSVDEMNLFENMLCDLTASAFRFLFDQRRDNNG